MCTEGRGWERGAKPGLRAVGFALLAALLIAALAWAQAADAPAGRSLDEAIDLALDAIEPPVVQPLLTASPEERRGIPAFPPYQQEPPAAQEDFRTPTSQPAPPKSGSSPGAGGGPVNPNQPPKN